MSPYVSNVECKQMRQLNEQGVRQVEIAQQYNRDQSTVSRHCSGYCKHATTTVTTPGIPTREEIIDALQTLADEIQCIPSETDWERWDGRCCAPKTVMNIFGDWPSAVAAAGFPTVSPNAPRAARSAVYNRPALARGYDD